jgi:hypothetical protein
MVLLALFVFALAKTFWPKRSVALPTVVAEPIAMPPGGTDAVASQLDELRAENDDLRRRLSEVEDAVQERASRGSLRDE